VLAADQSPTASALAASRPNLLFTGCSDIWRTGYVSRPPYLTIINMRTAVPGDYAPGPPESQPHSAPSDRSSDNRAKISGRTPLFLGRPGMKRRDGRRNDDQGNEIIEFAADHSGNATRQPGPAPLDTAWPTRPYTGKECLVRWLRLALRERTASKKWHMTDRRRDQARCLSWVKSAVSTLCRTSGLTL
jgi:hypothetical protein